MCYNLSVATPYTGRKGGVFMQDLLISFLISVGANIVAYYICKWLGRDDSGNQPKD